MTQNLKQKNSPPRKCTPQSAIKCWFCIGKKCRKFVPFHESIAKIGFLCTIFKCQIFYINFPRHKTFPLPQKWRIQNSNMHANPFRQSCLWLHSLTRCMQRKGKYIQLTRRCPQVAQKMLLKHVRESGGNLVRWWKNNADINHRLQKKLATDFSSSVANFVCAE